MNIVDKYVRNHLCSEANRCGEEQKAPLLLDPCCGSGTVLYLARRLGYRTIGFDKSVACIEGAKQNLEYTDLFHENSVFLSVQVIFSAFILKIHYFIFSFM